jgi:hypothetical protein
MSARSHRTLLGHWQDPLLTREKSLVFAATVATVGSLAACSSSASNPMPPAPTAWSITVAPKGPNIVVGDTMRLSATVRSSTSAFMDPPPSIDWFSRSPSVAQVDSLGQAWGVAGGSAWIVARVRSSPSLTDSTQLTVAVLISGADSVAIVEAAARWYASRAPSSSRVGFLLPRRSPSDPTPTAGQLEGAHHGAEILHATLMPIDSMVAYLCGSKPGGCGPGKFDLIVDVRVFKITGNASQVWVDQVTPGPGPRLRTSHLGWLLLFVRTGDEWAFNRILEMAAS